MNIEIICNLHTPIVIVDTYGMLNVTCSTFKNTRHRDQHCMLILPQQDVISHIRQYQCSLIKCLFDVREAIHFTHQDKIMSRDVRKDQQFNSLSTVSLIRKNLDLCVDNIFNNFYLFVPSYDSSQIQQLVLTFSPE